MARKNLLSGLVSPELTDVNSDAAQAARPEQNTAPQAFTNLAGRGPLGAVSRSIEQMRAQSVAEIEPAVIDVSFIADRLAQGDDDTASLAQSIKESGQQVPILVRPHPDKTGHYQVAYGHRRLRAVASLGLKVRAVVKPLTDEQLVVAQGQENSARTDLSFIERALFAARLEASQYGRETIMAALSVDKTTLSKLISAAVKVPADLIEAVGPAPKAGRDRWVALADRLEARQALAKARALISEEDFQTSSTDARFVRLFDALAPSKVRAQAPKTIAGADGKKVAQVREDARRTTVIFDKKAVVGFDQYLVDQLPELYAAFRRREGA